MPAGNAAAAGAAVEDRSPAPSSKGAQTRAAILHAAIDRFGRDGYRSTSLTDIARDADVGPTVAYQYFAGKEALFLAALDVDAAGIIDEARSAIFGANDDDAWRTTMVLTLVAAVEHHPLAQRVLAGLEPHATFRMLELPALDELRGAVAERLRADQAAGAVRPDIDPVAVGNGAVTVMISLLMSVIQFGQSGVQAYGSDVLALFSAAIDPVPHAAR